MQQVRRQVHAASDAQLGQSLAYSYIRKAPPLLWNELAVCEQRSQQSAAQESRETAEGVAQCMSSTQ